MKRPDDISNYIHPLKKGESQAYLTNSLQVPDLLDWILSQTGKAEIFQTSFSISEEYIRRLYFIRKKGAITKTTLILDNKATNKTLRLWKFIDEVFDEVYLADNHSKILLVKPIQGLKHTIVTSQNLTRGNRLESAVISADEMIFNNLLAQYNDIVKFHSVPLHELIRQRTQGY
jgi:hypothetical protein